MSLRTLPRWGGASPMLWALWLLLALALPPSPLLFSAFSQAAPDQAKGDLQARIFGDAPRYFAYARAMLGLPYQAHYIRDATNWRDLADDPAPALVTPARPLRPWRDFLVEYPPGAVPFFIAPALLARDSVEYCCLFGWEMSLALSLAMILGARTAERVRAGAGDLVLGGGLLAFLCGPSLVCQHFDALVALCLAVFAHGIVTGRPVQSALGLAAGICVKGAPAVLIPLALVHFASEAPWRRVAGALAAAAAFLFVAGAIYLVVAGAHAADLFAYHALRPVQIESPYAAAALAWGELVGAWPRMTYSFGSYNLATDAEPLARTAANILTALAVVAPLVWRVARREFRGRSANLATLAACSATLCGLFAFGKVFSPQYVVWLVPLGFLAAARGGRAFGLLAAALLAVGVEYPFVFDSAPALLGFVALARDALLIGAGFYLLAGSGLAASPAKS